MDRPKPITRLMHALTYGNIWLYVLSLLKKKKLHAYSLDREIEEKFSFKPNRIMVYVILYKLEAEGLISSKFEERRKYYDITAKGKKILSEGRKLLIDKAKEL